MPHDEDRRERAALIVALAWRLTFTSTMSRSVIRVPTMLTSTTVGWQIHDTSQCVRNCIYNAIASRDAIAMRVTIRPGPTLTAR